MLRPARWLLLLKLRSLARFSSTVFLALTAAVCRFERSVLYDYRRSIKCMRPFVVTRDMARTDEVTGKVNEKLVPELSKVPGFVGYYLIEAGNGVLSSLGLFETSEQADESSKFVAKWITDENLSTAIPNGPKITSGTVVAHSNGVTAAA
jgi:hypothetical protein